MSRNEYRQWLRMGVRLFDTPESVLLPDDRRSYMRIADLEAAAELLGLKLNQDGRENHNYGSEPYPRRVPN